MTAEVIRIHGDKVFQVREVDVFEVSTQMQKALLEWLELSKLDVANMETEMLASPNIVCDRSIIWTRGREALGAMAGYRGAKCGHQILRMCKEMVEAAWSDTPLAFTYIERDGHRFNVLVLPADKASNRAVTIYEEVLDGQV